MIPESFVRQTTTSPEWSVWALMVGDEVIGSVLVRSDRTRAEAWAAFGQKQAQDAAVRAYLAAAAH